MVCVTLYAERRQCWESTEEEKLVILFILHKEFFGLKDALVEFDVVGCKFFDKERTSLLNVRRFVGWKTCVVFMW